MAALAILVACNTASVPEFENRTSSTDGTTSTIARAASASSSYGNAYIVLRSRIAAVTASVISGCA